MSRHFTESKLVIASHNPGKVKEITALLEPFGFDVVSASVLGLEEPEETGSTFAANAELKARAAAQGSGLVTLADDSGLAVRALGGDPGVYSARWAGPNKNFSLAMQTVEDRLSGKDDRSACFVCALALFWPDNDNEGHLEVFEGRVNGTLVWPPRGSQGFGYDPMFVANSFGITFAEMKPEDKHLISHRANAFRKLVNGCFRN
jgi:XTP/dITP diphosphohydrolase